MAKHEIVVWLNKCSFFYREPVYARETSKGAVHDASSLHFDLPVDSEHKVGLRAGERSSACP